ncbi:CCA tRNA nucleotidyltransferase [Paracoccus sp. SCSIO 75233]|uniref:CCA tRNA nucleotidyltransferase n=1 Tax=Paracoccus sp. SCSIO 75233 TaxID=3017782 RepID=UPI0022F0E0F0|nr:CCA tRNA nucleotidyltransferase [Paracoccus sp. SCSIO 75233]WBU53125.1 CCA tRNA nucleotidyltransferase [Paracoccus sp. SCSIO 75233]
MRLDAAFLQDPSLRRVLEVLEHGGHRALIVGGAVRNALIGQDTGDVDIATSATPEQVVSLAEAAGLRTIPTGIEHGTVTVLSDHQPFEVTTFRRDVETDGRRAVVAFSDRIEDDAMRRDFTMNALYATPGGEVLDPVGGLPDLHSRTLRFVGDADQRIAEDYLRILRFFRFLAWYGENSAPGTVEAIIAGRDGLAQVSKERIGAEFRKLLAAPDPSNSIRLMQETGVLERLLPGADPQILPDLIAVEREYAAPPDWRRRLAVLGGRSVPDMLRLSRPEAGWLAALAAGTEMPLEEFAYRHGKDQAQHLALIRLAGGDETPPDWTTRIAKAAASPLPIVAADLMPALTGPALGQGLKAAEGHWIASGFTAPKSTLIAAALKAGEDR